MNMYGDLVSINNILRNDSDLWKLLYYKSKNFYDDPLSKPDILTTLPPKELNSIIDLRLKHTPVTDDLAIDDSKGINRIIFYPAPRRPQGGNYEVARQEINVDIFSHKSFNDTDMRLSKICDRVNELFSNKHVAGLGKAEFVNGKPFTLADKGYIGYTLTYRFGSVSAK